MNNDKNTDLLKNRDINELTSDIEKNTFGEQAPSEEELPDMFAVSEELDLEGDLYNFTETLKQQVNRELDEDQSSLWQDKKKEVIVKKKEKKKINKILKIICIVFAVLLILIILILGTKTGRKVLYKIASGFIYSNVDNEEVIKEYQNSDDTNGDDNASGTTGGEQDDATNEGAIVARSEDYVTNYMIFGIEEFGGARNTDSMMIASINTKDNSIKLTSLLRDSYVEIPGYNPNKLNSAYAKGGVKTLIDTIEQNYLVQIDGYASVDFSSFEKIVDYLGGITIELGEKEAHYLNTTNYISNKKYRNVKAGINKLNGNQVLGYCRVRKCETLGGATDDYGRIIRQQRALDAIFKSYKSQSLFKYLGIMKDCLGNVTTSLTEKQIEKAMSDIVENKITTLDKLRIPVNGAFDALDEYKGVGDPLVLDWDVNRQELFKYIFLDTEKEAKAALATQ